MILKTTLVMVLLGFIQPVFAKNPAPEWTQGAVWYYVIPERFRNINPHNDPLKLQIVGKDSKDWQVHPWASDWYKLQIWESRRNLKFDELVGLRRYGGDLLGVLEKLYYLKDLGINVIYLTPIFESPSILKYDVSSLHHIDDNLGFAHEGAWGRITPEKKKNDGEKKNSEEKVVPETEDPKTWALSKSDEVFIELLSKAHELGMKVVITSVFHYCGRDFWAFRDVLQKQQDSDYKDWFEVVGWDDPATPDTVEFDYKSWHDDKSLPLFRQDENGLSEPIRKYIYDSTRRWLDPNADGDPADGVDGWAVHEAEALPEPFLTDWIKLVKSIKPNAVTLADAHSAWFANGNKFDLTMTQTFTQLLQDFFVHQKYSVSKLFEELDGLRTGSDGLASEVHRLGDHRTDRIATIIRNSVNSDSTGVTPNNSHEYDPRKPDKQQREIQKALTVFQLTYPGAPMILYGDES
ncbi:MAG TPA: alpha-amylase family glycosyl hydrolase, partial [bacterium]